MTSIQIKRKPKLKDKINQWIVDLDRTQGNSFEALLGRMIDYNTLRSQESELKKINKEKTKYIKKQDMLLAYQCDCKIGYLEQSIADLKRDMKMDHEKLLEYKKQKRPFTLPKLKTKKAIPKGNQKSILKVKKSLVLKTVSFTETGVYRVYDAGDGMDSSPFDETKRNLEELQEEEEVEACDIDSQGACDSPIDSGEQRDPLAEIDLQNPDKVIEPLDLQIRKLGFKDTYVKIKFEPTNRFASFKSMPSPIPNDQLHSETSVTSICS